MQLILADDDGTVLEIVEDIEEYDLNKATASRFLIYQLQAAIDRALETAHADEPVDD